MGAPSSGSSLGSLLNHRYFVIVVVSISAQLPENIFLTKILNIFAIIFSRPRRGEAETAKAKAAQIIVAKGRDVVLDAAGEDHREGRVEGQIDICQLTS